MNSNSPKRSVFIDCGKVIAAAGVLIDHFYTRTYLNETVFIMSFYSISLFIFLSGMTSYMSLSRHQDEPAAKTVWRRIRSFALPYLLAVALYQFFYEGSFNFLIWVTDAVFFKLAGGFYFVPVYIELLLISPAIFAFIRKGTQRWGFGATAALTAAFTCIIGRYCEKFTHMFDLYGAGAYLFGGEFLTVFALGMLFAAWDFSFKKPISAAVSSVVSTALFAYFVSFFSANVETINNPWPYMAIWQRNPPGLYFMIFGLITAWMVFSLVSLAGFFKIGSKITSQIARLGKYSLYIFLYHALCLDILPKFIRGNMHYSVRNFIISILCAFTPIIVKWLYDRVKERLF